MISVRLLWPAIAGTWVSLLSVVVMSRSGSSPTWSSAALGVCLAVVIVASLARVMSLIRGTREKRAGYTTLPNTHLEVDQLDPATWKVVRRAGEGYLSRAELRSRRLLLSQGFPLDLATRPSGATHEPVAHVLVRGASALTWGRRAALGWVLAVAVSCAWVIAAMSLPPGLSRNVVRAAFAVVVVLVAWEACAIGFFVRQRRREARAGYTTMPAAFQHLDQVIPASGTVIRPAGEAFLSRRELHKRKAATLDRAPAG
jgi:hypothetical protein